MAAEIGNLFRDYSLTGRFAGRQYPGQFRQSQVATGENPHNLLVLKPLSLLVGRSHSRGRGHGWRPRVVAASAAAHRSRPRSGRGRGGLRRKSSTVPPVPCASRRGRVGARLLEA